MNKSLEKLRELTEQLPAPLLSTMSTLSSGYGEYEVDGTCIGFTLHNQAEVAVQRSFICTGTFCPNHEHNSHEFLLVYQGRLVVHLHDTEYPIGVADCIHIEPNTPHSVMATDDSWLLGITVPAEEGYPHDGRK